MNLTQSEAQESLAAIEEIARKTRRSIASGGTTITLIITGFIWLVGFLGTQFLDLKMSRNVWIGANVFGLIAAFILGSRKSKQVRSPSTAQIAKRVWIFWLLHILFSIALVLVIWPIDGRQMTMLVILLALMGHMAMGLFFPYALAWWTLPVAAMALIGYFFVTDYYYLWMAVLGGGTMIALGVIIRRRW